MWRCLYQKTLSGVRMYMWAADAQRERCFQMSRAPRGTSPFASTSARKTDLQNEACFQTTCKGFVL